MKIKAIVIKNKIERKNKLKEKRGSELAQTIIMVVVIATLFFPQIQSIFSTSMSKLSGWFDQILNTL